MWRTKYSGKRVAMATALSLQIDGSGIAPTMPGPFMWSWHWKTRPGQIVCVGRLLWPEATPRMQILAASHGKSSAPDRSVGARSSKSTRRLGQIGGVPAISRSGRPGR